MIQGSQNISASDHLWEIMTAFDFLKTVGLCEQEDMVLAVIPVLLKLTVCHRAQIKADPFWVFLQ